MATEVRAVEVFRYLGRRVTYRGHHFELTGILDAVSAEVRGGGVAVVLTIAGFDVDTRGDWVVSVDDGG